MESRPKAKRIELTEAEHTTVLHGLRQMIIFYEENKHRYDHEKEIKKVSELFDKFARKYEAF